MSVMIYMTVEVEGEQIKPNVHVSTFMSVPWAHGGGTLPEIPTSDVRFGLQVAEQVLGFAERLEGESS